MTLDLLPGLALFAFVTSITPGPNNLMLMASGANFGLRRTLPHMLGVGIGFVMMVALVGLGLIGLFDRFPALYRVLTAVSVVYLLWLAWKIATAAPRLPDDKGPQGRPITFLQAAAFQWVNPKAWSMALSALTLHAADHTVAGVAVVALVFGAINLPSVGCWTLLGQQMRRFLTSPGRLRGFNVTMALLLVTTLYPLMTAEVSGLMSRLQNL